METRKWTIVAALLTASVSGCSAADGSPHANNLTPDAVVQNAAVLDPKMGTITYPLEEYFFSWSEHQTVLNAATLALGTCARRLGIEYTYKPLIPELGDDRDFGVWVPDYAARYGYHAAMSEEKAAAVAGTTAPDFGEVTPDQHESMVDECVDSPQVTQFREVSGSGPWSDPIDLAYSAVLTSTEAADIRKSWRDCLEKAGVEPPADEEAFDALAVGENAEMTETEIRVAVADAQCKSEVGMVQKLADLLAAYHSPIIAEYRTELEAVRVKQEAQLADAEEFLAGRGY